MPRPVKSERPVIAEPVVEHIQSTAIVVIHPGSSNLIIGRATDHAPRFMPHVIARKITNDQFHPLRVNPLRRPGCNYEETDEKRKFGLKSTKSLIQSVRINGGYRKPRVSSNEVSAYNQNVYPTPSENDDSTESHWTDVSHMPDFVIGEEALNLQSNAPFHCRWPIKHGQLNLHDGVGGTPSALAEDIVTLWGNAIETLLNIPIGDLSFYRAVLLVPDNFNRSHVKLLVDLILNRLNFSCVIACQESVCGAFGSGLPSACVVDCGAQKTNICCVEDGLSLATTRLTLNYGGNDITRCFYNLLLKSNFPYQTLDFDDPMDIQLLQELKETYCHLSMDIPSGHVHEFQVMRPDQPTMMYKIRLGDEPILAPSAMFVPDLFGIVNERLIETFPEVQDHDSEDLTDDRYLLEKRDVEPKKTKETSENKENKETVEQTEQQQQSSQEYIALTTSVLPPTNQQLHSKLEDIRLDGMPIDEAIAYSIEQCSNSETKRKMYSTILLIGGGLNFKGADNFLLKRVQARLPAHFNYLKEQMEVINRPKENDPRTAGWKGGGVLSILDSSQELWISRKEWNQYGVRILRERCAFQWSTNMDKQ
ncbi:actin-related protein 8-like [Clytia hemisphaerica]|uniref:Actin-related protein 8 n=1 Tax=Clytia hemisphaerica TaxID=252671 RepID=A0A7M5VAV4_9CNID